jgi:hemoglobin
MSDIASEDDIKKLVNGFYEKARKSLVIGHIFNDVVKVNWEHHLPVMYSFWSSILLGTDTYKGNPMTKHIELNKQVALTGSSFTEWVSLFRETVDDLFEGSVTEEAKKRAANIAAIMKYKIDTNG